MDGDGLALFLLFMAIAFLAGVTFGVCMIKYDNSKPPIDEEAIIFQVKEQIKQMSVTTFIDWLRL